MKSRIYHTSNQSLDRVDLEGFLVKYNLAKEEALASYRNQYQQLLAREQDKWIQQWNQQNEASYEGSLDELGLEARVLSKLGPQPDVRLVPGVQHTFEAFAKEYQPAKNASWFWPQAVAKFSQLKLTKTTGGYSAKRLFLDHILPNPRLLALYHIFQYQKRSLFLEQQTKPEHRNYSSLVPVILSGFKQMHGIEYNQWDPSEVHGLVEHNLWQAMQLRELPQLTTDELIAERNQALEVKTGAKIGEQRSPSTTYSLYFKASSPLAAIPALARVMMCQTWCAHPSNRSPLMILNPLDWDDMPDPLVSGAVLSAQPPIAGGATSDLPW